MCEDGSEPGDTSRGRRQSRRMGWRWDCQSEEGYRSWCDGAHDFVHGCAEGKLLDVPGMRESVETFQKEIKGTSSSEVMNMIMYCFVVERCLHSYALFRCFDAAWLSYFRVTQYIDMLKELGSNPVPPPTRTHPRACAHTRTDEQTQTMTHTRTQCDAHTQVRTYTH